MGGTATFSAFSFRRASGLLIALVACTSILLGGCGGNGNLGGSTGGASSPTATISANPTSISVGGSTTITWSSTNANSCTASGAWSGSQKTNGTATESPATAGTYTYTLTCAGDGGSTSASATVTVSATPPLGVSSVSASCAQSSINAGQTDQCSATVTYSDGSSKNDPSLVAWSVSPSNAGTVSATGVFTASSSLTATTPVTLIASSNQSGYTNVSGSTTVTVNVGSTMPTVSSVSASCNPSSVSAGDTSTCTAVVTYSDGSTKSSTSDPSLVTWSVATANAGTISSAGLYTASTSITSSESVTIVATSTQTSVAGQTIVAVSPSTSLPNITSISPGMVYADQEEIVGGIQLTGTGFQTGQTISSTPDINLQSAQVQSSTQATIAAGYDTAHYSPGWDSVQVCTDSAKTHCGTPGTFGFMGAFNYLAIASSGELFFLNQGSSGGNEKYKADGTQDGSCSAGSHSIAVDDKTGNLLVDGYATDENCSNANSPQPSNLPPQTEIMGDAARNGYGCFVDPSAGSVGCYDITGNIFSNPTLYTTTNVGTSPWAIAMGTFGSETDAFVFSRNGTPSFFKVRASDASVEGSVALPGITPASTVQKGSPAAGGWYEAVLDSGPGSGIAAVLSVYDGVLDLVNTGSMTIVQKVQLSGSGAPSGIPFRVAADPVNGGFIVAIADSAKATVTYIRVSANSGAITPLSATDTLLSVGLGVSADGTKLYSCQRNACHVLNNQ